MLKKLMSFLMVFLLTACMTTGYHYAKDPNMVKKWDVTVVSVKPQNIYNSVGVALVGPLASVEAKGLEVIFVVGGEKKQMTVVQPASDKYELHAGQRAVYIVSKGHVWVQPADYPLPPEFSATNTPTIPQTNSQQDSAVVPLKSEQSKPSVVTPKTPVSSSQTQRSEPSNASIESSTAKKLRELQTLKKEGLITESEYQEKKSKLLDQY